MRVTSGIVAARWTPRRSVTRMSNVASGRRIRVRSLSGFSASDVPSNAVSRSSPTSHAAALKRPVVTLSVNTPRQPGTYGFAQPLHVCPNAVAGNRHRAAIPTARFSIFPVAQSERRISADAQKRRVAGRSASKARHDRYEDHDQSEEDEDQNTMQRAADRHQCSRARARPGPIHCRLLLARRPSSSEAENIAQRGATRLDCTGNPRALVAAEEA